MSPNQHHAGLHFIRHRKKPVTYKNLSVKCDCGSSMGFVIDPSGKTYRCSKCGAIRYIREKTDLSKMKESVPGCKELAIRYQKEKRGEDISEGYCPICGSSLTNDYYCRKCQQWRK